MSNVLSRCYRKKYTSLQIRCLHFINSPSFSILLMDNSISVVSNPKTLASKTFPLYILVEIFYTFFLTNAFDYLFAWIFFFVCFQMVYFWVFFLDASLDLCLNPSLHGALNHRTFCLDHLWKEVLILAVAQMWTLRFPVWGEVGDRARKRNQTSPIMHRSVG